MFSHSQFKDPNVAVSETLLTYLPTLENAVAAEAPYMVSYDGEICNSFNDSLLHLMKH